MTYFELWKWGEKRLADAGIAEASLDARYLLLEAFEMDMARFLLKEQEQVPATEGRTREYSDAIQARAARVPLQYLTGKQDFMGLTFHVDERVLIPRQDTETLVELVLKENTDKKARILDLCTGSGCIAVSLAVLGGYRKVDAVDISEDALAAAEENGTRLGGKVRFLKSDLFSALDPEKKYDIITSNPPYIPTEVLNGLEPEVKDYEPRMALDGSEDGLAFYRRIAVAAPAFSAGRRPDLPGDRIRSGGSGGGTAVEQWICPHEGCEGRGWPRQGGLRGTAGHWRVDRRKGKSCLIDWMIY